MARISTNSVVLIFAFVLFFYNSASLNIKLTALLFFLEITHNIELFSVVQNSTNLILLISDIIFLFLFYFEFFFATLILSRANFFRNTRYKIIINGTI